MYTLPAVLDRGRTLFPDAGVSDGTDLVPYDEVYDHARRLAGTLADAGVEPGDVVAVADWNTPRFFELLYAVTGMGATVYPVNLNLPPADVGYTLEASDTSRLVYSDDFAAIGDAFPGPTHAVDDLALGEPASLEVDQEAHAVMLFTSGTTGRPKAVRYRHREFVQGALAIAHQLAEYDTPAAIAADDALYPGIPMFHLLSWGSVLIAPYLGADLVLAGRFDPERLAGALADGTATWTNLVPTMLRQVLATDADLSGGKVLAGGSAIPADLASAMADRGMGFTTIYGGTDMLAASVAIETDYARDHGGADYRRRVTHPVPFGEFRLERREGMAEDMGAIRFRAPWLPGEYYGDPEASEAAYVDGWFETGDLGRLHPDGGLEVLDRLGDAIKSGGEWIPTSVLESVIAEVPGVGAAAVVGRADDEWGERPVAAVTGTASDEAIRAGLEAAVEAGRLNDWWLPDEIERLDELPLTSTGKVQKTALRERFEGA